jgi:pilus assembly protein CpaB
VKNLTPAKLIVMMMVAMGLLVTLYVGKTLLADKTPPPRRIGTRTVSMLVGDVEVGTVLTAHHIGMGPWPANEIKGDVLLGQTAIIGRVVRKSMKAAEPIHGSDLFPMHELPPLTVSDGYRAMTIHLADAAAVMNGLLRPGDHVDIEFTPRTNVTSDPRYQEIGGLSIVLFKGVRILAFNRAFVQTDLESSGNNVTLEVAQNDVAVLRLADENGDLYLSYTPDANGSMTVTVANPDRLLKNCCSCRRFLKNRSLLGQMSSGRESTTERPAAIPRHSSTACRRAETATAGIMVASETTTAGTRITASLATAVRTRGRSMEAFGTVIRTVPTVL